MNENKPYYTTQLTGMGYVVWNSQLNIKVSANAMSKEEATEWADLLNEQRTERLALLATVQVGQRLRLVDWMGQESEMVAIGKGLYPYDCPASKMRPDDMIYQDELTHSWTHSYGLAAITWWSAVEVVQ